MQPVWALGIHVSSEVSHTILSEILEGVKFSKFDERTIVCQNLAHQKINTSKRLQDIIM